MLQVEYSAQVRKFYGGNISCVIHGLFYLFFSLSASPSVPLSPCLLFILESVHTVSVWVVKKHHFEFLSPCMLGPALQLIINLTMYALHILSYCNSYSPTFSFLCSYPYFLIFDNCRFHPSWMSETLTFYLRMWETFFSN